MKDEIYFDQVRRVLINHFFDNRHTITWIEAGAWKRKTTVRDGKDRVGDRYDFQTQQVVEAGCSCGKTFTNSNDAWKHIEEVKNQQT